MNITETNKNETVEIKVLNVSDLEAKVEYGIHYGGNYLISVLTVPPNAVPSPLINYRAPELPPPHQVKVFSMSDGYYEVHWRKPTLPSKLHPS